MHLSEYLFLVFIFIRVHKAFEFDIKSDLFLYNFEELKKSAIDYVASLAHVVNELVLVLVHYLKIIV